MIKIKFKKDQSNYIEVGIKGHSNYDQFNQDIVCAAITGIATGMLNALNELFATDVELDAKNGYILIKVKQTSADLQLLLQALYYQLLTVKQQYDKNIELKEV